MWTVQTHLEAPLRCRVAVVFDVTLSSVSDGVSGRNEQWEDPRPVPLL